MDLEILWKAIVPLSFLAIWALTALFNREPKAVPNRPASGQSPLGPRPVPPRPVEAIPRQPPPIRWAPQGTAPASGRLSGPSPGGDDDIVILETSRPVRPAGRAAGASKRPKAKSQPGPKPTPPAPPRSGFEGVSQSVNQTIATSLTIAPLSQGETPSSSRPVAATSASPHESTLLGGRTLSIIAALRDPAKIREAFLINEILQPPLALRKRSR